MVNFIGKAHAAITFPDLNPFTGTLTLSTALQRIASVMLILAGAIAVIYLIYGGILYITASGDAEKATKGRTAVINAIIGIIIILLALVIVTWVKNLVKTGTNL